MKFNIQKSGAILMKNPNIMLLLVTYLLIMASILPVVVLSYTKGAIFYIFSILVFLFTCAFFSGWFGMIKSVVQYKETNNIEEELKQRHESFKNGFFASIPTHLLSLVFYILLFIGYVYLLFSLANNFLGRQEEIINGLTTLKGDQDAIINYISTLPADVLENIIKRSALVYIGIVVYFLFTLYSVPALYFTETKNPIIGLKNGFLAFIKKPLGSFVLFLGLAVCHIFLIFFEAISVVNTALMFFALVLRLCFMAFLVVLIFSVYETNFASDCNNGPDSLGENEARS